MLTKYFLKQFFSRFTLFFIGLVPLFASCDVVVRLASIPFSFKIIKFFGFMLPLVSVFAIPIASCIAIGMTVGNLFVRDELLFFHFFKLARFHLKKSVFIFSIVLLSIYIPMVFDLAPKSYWDAKRFLIRSVQFQIEGLPAQKFHNIASRCTIFFKNKAKTPEGYTKFEDILLMAKEKNNREYFVVASSGKTNGGMLEFFNGTIYNQNNKNQCVATFKSLEIAFEKMFFDAESKTSKPVKFLQFNELKNLYDTKEAAFKEFHKRVIQTIWQFLLPFIVLFAMMIFGRKKSNLLLSVVVSGAMFLFSYISFNMASFFLKREFLSLTFFYSIPFFITFIFYLAYKNKWR